MLLALGNDVNSAFNVRLPGMLSGRKRIPSPNRLPRIGPMRHMLSRAMINMNGVGLGLVTMAISRSVPLLLLLGGLSNTV